ncbi:retrovirus-related pol polyprotein from transposon TNT 1-94 [Tanacetum coccineum]
MSFISTSFASRYPPTNNQLRTSSNPRNQATIQDGRVTVQNVQGRQSQGYASSGSRGNATGINRSVGSNTTSQAKVVRCYNCQGEGHMAKQCTKPKRPKNSEWFKEKMLLVQALESGAVLDEEQMAFLADNMDAVPSHDINLNNNVFDNNVQELQYSEQPPFIDDSNIESTSDSGFHGSSSSSSTLGAGGALSKGGTTSLAQQDALIMSVIEELSNKVAQCNALNKENKIVNESLTAELETYKEHVKIFEERQKFDLNDREKYIDFQMRDVIVKRNAKFADFEKEIQSLKLHLSAHMSDNKLLTTTIDVLKKETKEKEDKYLDEIIALEKKKKDHKTALGYQNPLYLTKAQLKQPTLYCGQTIVKKHDALFVPDSKETLELATASRVKMLEKQNDPIAKEKNVIIKPIDYDALNKLSEHFSAHFVPPKQLFAEQAFWLPISKPTSEKPPVQPEPVPKEIPRELPTISLVKDSFNKMRSHVNNFDKVITVRTKVTGQNEGTWGFEHIRCAFEKDVIPFAKTLKEYFQMFDQGLVKEITEMKDVFNQMETEVDTYVMCIAMHADVENKCVVPAINDILAYAEMEQSYIDEYSKVLELEAELSKKKNMVEKVVYYELSNICSRLENRWMYKLDLPPISPKLKRNREVDVDYLQKAKEQCDTLRDIVEQAKALKPLDNTLEYDCKFTTRIQELCTKSWSAKRNKKQEWKPTGHVFTYVGHRWIPTGRAFTIDENKCPLTRSFSKFMGTVRFGNDHVTTIMGYGDYQIGNVMISWVYYVEGLGHNLFSVGQFCDSDLEVAFHKHTYFVRDLKGVDLLKGSRGTNLYTLSLEEMMQSSPTCILSKASKTKS